MKFSIGQSELSAAVGLAGQAVSTRSTLPVLSNVLLQAADGAVTISATNLETGMCVTVPAEVIEAGGVTLPARLFSAALGGIPGDARVKVELFIEKMAATLTYFVNGKRKGAATIKGISADEFPAIPTADGPATLSFTGSDLSALIRQSAFASADANDTARPALTGVLWTAGDGRLTSAATDGYRLAVAEHACDVDLPQLIIPARALALADKLSNVSEAVEVSVADGRVAFTFTGSKAAWREATLVAQAIDAKFPNYNALMPKTCTTTVTADTGELIRALKMAALFAKDASDRVILTINPGLFDDTAMLNIAAAATESGNFNTDLECNITGEALMSAFNVAYILQGLAALGLPTARLEFTRADRPVLLVGKQFRYVIMPMILTK